MTTAEVQHAGPGPAETVTGGDAGPAEKEHVPGPGAAAVPDPAAAVLAALDLDSGEPPEPDRPGERTRAGYARDWALWEIFHGWLAERTGTPRPLGQVTPGTMAAFVTWLDRDQSATPNTIERRITGVTFEARRLGHTVPKEATRAARRALKQLRLDPGRQAGGRSKTAAVTPDGPRTTAGAQPDRDPRPAARRRRVRPVPELARLRDQALAGVKSAVIGSNEEMSAMDDPSIQEVDEGLTVRVPGVQGCPDRPVTVLYGEHPATCPVRCWLAWRTAKLAAGAHPGGPAFLPVDQWGHLGTVRLSPDGVGRALARCAATPA